MYSRVHRLLHCVSIKKHPLCFWPSLLSKPKDHMICLPTKFRLKSCLGVKQQIKPIQCTYYYTILTFRSLKSALKWYWVCFYMSSETSRYIQMADFRFFNYIWQIQIWSLAFLNGRYAAQIDLDLIGGRRSTNKMAAPIWEFQIFFGLLNLQFLLISIFILSR